MAVLAAFGSWNANAQPPDDDAILAIESGRLVAMLDQVSTLMKLPEAEQPSTPGAAAALGFAVARYNTLLRAACGKMIVEEAECRTAYAPPLQPEPVPAGILRLEMDDAQARISRFWQTVCAKLDDRKNPSCQME